MLLVNIMETKSFKTGEVERKWFLVNLEGQTLGRASARIARILLGKHKVQFTPHSDVGDFIVVINASKVRLTGKKLNQKIYYTHSRYVGGLKMKTAKELLEKNPETLIKEAVWGMLPKGVRGRKMFKKLKVYRGDKHPHQAQKPEIIDISKF